MGRRSRKPPVKPEVRRAWLRRYEEDGESPPQIAAADSFDVRTVRKQIEMARQEREVREARSTVLRNALESHYADICNFAEKLKVAAAGEESISLLVDDPLWLALKQHLPRSPLWNLLNRRDTLLERLDGARGSIRTRLISEVEADARLKPVLSSGGSGVIPGMVDSLSFQVEQWSQGRKGLDIETYFRVKPAEDDLVSIEYGAFPLGKIRKQQAQTVRDVLADWQLKVASWEESDEMGRILTELQRVRLKLKEEFNTITMRRIVPGRCKYCPA
ncbi:hypothetical protein ACFLVX_02425 [Chloroflexota bacterium]